MRDVVLKLFDALDKNDLTGILALFTDDAVYERPGKPIIRGRDALVHFYEHERVVAAGKHTIEEIIEGPVLTVTVGFYDGAGGDGAPLYMKFVDVYQFTGEKIHERRSYFLAPPDPGALRAS